ncbi:response regulator [Halopseudomonas laoshanensis]|uniref:Response regulator n=1 Tax=Halopseudomonas laoshanensis TaxID=2268758 RepID=A0A7V7KUW0_9GAMM|nr:response regulator [Halopseudomonas laoshanensis]KAA0694091.1 response regulator [Halopseudomonas laoshanensis]
MTELERILHIDDQKGMLEIARIALEIIGGFSLRSCSSGAEGLAQLDAFEPQLILLDVSMPGMDGPATLARLRQLPAWADTPVVFTATRAQEQDAQHLPGVVGMLIKPFDPMTLADQVNAIWLQGQT